MKPSISLIIPVYNEEARLRGCTSALLNWKPDHRIQLHEVIFVNDGSRDRTAQKLEHAATMLKRRLRVPVRIISYAINQGKGFAVKTGVLAASGDYILTLDADMSTHPKELSKFIPLMNEGVDVIVGTRKNGHSTVVKHQPFFRELFGHLFTRLTHAIVPSQVTDYTCGFKAFKRNAAHAIFLQVTTNRWAYDVESLFLATKHGYSLTEVPVVWTHKDGTKVRIWKDAPHSMLALLQIRFTDALGGYTDGNRQFVAATM